ncbi:MAG TPA: hypothetical protein VMV06_07185 [Acidimicrobiales bacterium]|nr:hypothetical protein [Acidimicrobiales bacterium]
MEVDDHGQWMVTLRPVDAYRDVPCRAGHRPVLSGNRILGRPGHSSQHGEAGACLFGGLLRQWRRAQRLELLEE